MLNPSSLAECLAYPPWKETVGVRYFRDNRKIRHARIVTFTVGC